MFGNEFVNGLFFQRGEYLDVSFCIIITDIEPELIKLIWCRPLRVKPDIAAFRLAELLAVALRDERAGQGKGLHLARQGDH